MNDKIEYIVEWCVGLVPYRTERASFEKRADAKNHFRHIGKRYEYITLLEVCTRSTVLLWKPDR